MNPNLAKQVLPQNRRTEENHPGSDRRLLAGYLHKTSNTLCGIKGYASLIADRTLPDGEAGQWARKIILEVERMEEIFRSVGDLSRSRQNPDTGVDLPRFLTETAAACAEDPGTMNLTILDVPAGEILLPASDLALVLREVLTNAGESAEVGSPPVNVEVAGFVGESERIYLEIHDNGCGMNKELVQQAPDPFITTKENHHGVGLTRVDTLMEMYGLQWSLDSKEGQGTRVIMEVAELI